MIDRKHERGEAVGARGPINPKTRRTAEIVQIIQIPKTHTYATKRTPQSQTRTADVQCISEMGSCHSVGARLPMGDRRSWPRCGLRRARVVGCPGTVSSLLATRLATGILVLQHTCTRTRARTRTCTHGADAYTYK